jgi:choline-glycine betaine transporter
MDDSQGPSLNVKLGLFSSISFSRGGDMTRLRRQEEKSIFKTLSLLFALLFLAACGGGGGE